MDAENYTIRTEELDIVNRALQGDEYAHSELYFRSFYKAVRVARLYNMDNFLTDDELYEVANEAFERSILKLHTYKNLSSYSAWVNGFVRNIILEFRRKSKKRYEIWNMAKNMDSVDLFYMNPENYVIMKELCICAVNAYYLLNNYNRLLIDLHILENLPTEKMCAILKISEEEAEIKIEKAIKIMKKNFYRIYDAAV